MILYRVEHKKTGIGPFRQENRFTVNPSFIDELEAVTASLCSHPTAYADVQKELIEGDVHVWLENRYCACTSFNQLIDFFSTKGLELIEKHGEYVLRKLEVKEAHVGKTGWQAFYLKEDIISQKEMSLSHLINELS